MPASPPEGREQPTRRSAAARSSGAADGRAAGAGRVSMRELLASCVAARAVSTPPWHPQRSAAERAALGDPVARVDACPDDDGQRGAAA